MSWRERLGTWLAERIAGKDLAQLAVSVRVDDSPGWSQVGRYPHDRTLPEIQELYEDALKAWRKNPIAWNTVRVIQDYVVGDGIEISSIDPTLQDFIEAFWNHPENMMGNRLDAMCDELTRSGDLFVLLFRNSQDGMSYIRFLTKDQIADIETKKRDWETELVYQQKPTEVGEDGQRWYSPKHGSSKRMQAVCLHYSVNRPLGALFGEGDLTAVLPWLLKYSRMVEERVRLHWAMRAFLWFVTVPTGKVKEKQKQYQTPPEPGSIVVKDDGESWEVQTPNLHGADASHDMKAVRNMIDAGTGLPPHWRGESEDVNLATAQAMQEPVERHLKRRQDYFVFILCDIIWQAYQRASDRDPVRWGMVERMAYKKLFTAQVTDISSSDNLKLAQATKELMAGFKELAVEFPQSSKLKRLMLKLALKFAGEPMDDEFLDAVVKEGGAVVPAASVNGVNGRLTAKEMG